MFWLILLFWKLHWNSKWIIKIQEQHSNIIHCVIYKWIIKIQDDHSNTQISSVSEKCE